MSSPGLRLAGVATGSALVRPVGVREFGLTAEAAGVNVNEEVPSAAGCLDPACAGGGAPEGGLLRVSEAATMTPITPASSPSLASLGIGFPSSLTRLVAGSNSTRSAPAPSPTSLQYSSKSAHKPLT